MGYIITRYGTSCHSPFNSTPSGEQQRGGQSSHTSISYMTPSYVAIGLYGPNAIRVAVSTMIRLTGPRTAAPLCLAWSGWQVGGKANARPPEGGTPLLARQKVGLRHFTGSPGCSRAVHFIWSPGCSRAVRPPLVRTPAARPPEGGTPLLARLKAGLCRPPA